MAIHLPFEGRLVRHQLLLVLSFVCSCSVVSEREERSTTRSQLVIGADDRVPLSPATVGSSLALKAIGRVATTTGEGCTATKVADRYVLTAAHCFSRTSTPSSFFFYPGAVYDGSHGPPNNYTGPRVSVTRIMRGAGGLSAPCLSQFDCGNAALCENSRCTAFDTGADFALLEVEPSSFVNGSPSVPTWSSVPAMAMQAAGPILPTASTFGYPFNIAATGGFLTGQKGCSLIKRTPADGYDQAGLYKTDCDIDETMSGGPATFSTIGGWTETRVLAIGGPDAGVIDAPESTNHSCVSPQACDPSIYGQAPVCLWSRCGRRCSLDADCAGGKCVRNLCRPACTPAFPLCGAGSTCVSGACVRSDYPTIFNQLVDVFPAIHSPWDAVGIAASVNADGRVNVTATDHARPNQVMMRTEAVLPHRPFDSWRDNRTGVSIPNPGRVSSVLYDNRQFVFVVGSDSQVYANWQTTPNGSFQGWTGFFSGDPMTSGVVDVASDTPTPLVVGPMYQYLLRSNGGVVMRRKTGGWAGPWDAWSTIATVPGLNRISAAMTEDYPVLVLHDATNVYVTWGQPGGSNWVAPQGFSDGLPTSRCLTDIEMGKTVDGRLDVFLLLREQCDPNRVAIYRRTKESASAYSAWGLWTRYRATAPALPGGPNDLVSSSELIGATALALLPPKASRGDGLLVVSNGAIYESAWKAATPAPAFLGWLPFYGPVRPWEGTQF